MNSVLKKIAQEINLRIYIIIFKCYIKRKVSNNIKKQKQCKAILIQIKTLHEIYMYCYLICMSNIIQNIFSLYQHRTTMYIDVTPVK